MKCDSFDNFRKTVIKRYSILYHGTFTDDIVLVPLRDF